MKYTVSLGYEGPTDCCLCINDKAFLIESLEWKIVGLFHSSPNMVNSEFGQRILKIMYEDEDNVDSVR